MAMTESQLRAYANRWLLDNYGMKLVVPFKLNGRLKKTLGWFTHSNKKPTGVQLNKQFVQNNDDEIVLSVLKHELVHYALFMKGEPYHDGEAHFENELKKKGIVSQSTIHTYSISSVLQIYQCVECDKIYKTKRRLVDNGIHHRCRCKAKGRLIDRGKRVVTT
ncbi:SprT-like family protein [Bacillus phage pW2]|uniref:SprT-like family protein n=1 Tax=Bacillus phage pW2 TaxID=2500559 RepID=A0A3Q9R7Q1_9CAUD|nr:SprT-like family protein [Bacillus phage pW2]AZU99008.1 SprT-like family protein [Bacillus phage pW2]